MNLTILIHYGDLAFHDPRTFPTNRQHKSQGHLRNTHTYTQSRPHTAVLISVDDGVGGAQVPLIVRGTLGVDAAFGSP